MEASAPRANGLLDLSISTSVDASNEKINLTDTLCSYTASPIASCFANDRTVRTAAIAADTWLPTNQTIIQETTSDTLPRVYKYIHDGPGRDSKDVLDLNEEMTNSLFVARDEIACEFLAFSSVSFFKSWFARNPDRRTLHEVIFDRRQLLKFDIDAKAEQLDKFPDLPSDPHDSRRTRKSRRLFDMIMEAIVATADDVYSTQLTEDDVSVSDSTDTSKYSRHIVITAFCVANHIEAKYFTAQLVSLLPDDVRPFVDQQVNSSVQNFRLPGCHKKGSARVKKCIWGTPDSMIISHTNHAMCMPALNVHVRPSIQLVADDESAIIDFARGYATGLEFHKRAGNIFCYKRIFPSYCVFCGRIHDRSDSLFLTVNDGHVSAYCRRKPGVSEYIGRVKIAQPPKHRQQQEIGDKEITRKVKAVKLPPTFSVLRYNETYMRKFDFSKCDTLLVKAHMGTGKTKQLVDYVKNLPESTHIVQVSFRRSYSTEIVAKFSGGLIDYRDTDGKIDSSRVVVQFESLHRLVLHPGRELLLIMDESESIINQMSNGSIKPVMFRKCWEKFKWLVTYATQVIAIDANALERTYTLLAESRKSVLMHINERITNDATDYYYSTRDQLLELISAAATHAKDAPFVVVSTVRKQSDAIAEEIRRRTPAANIKYYNADSTEETRRDFNDVNAAWADADVLIYTSTITAGCSFELPRFKTVYAYFCSRSVDYMTSIQMLGRVRDVASREYHIYIDDRGEKLHFTKASLERTMCEQTHIYDVATNPLNMPCEISEYGEYTWANKDLYYKLHFANLEYHVRSRALFVKLFQTQRAAAGFKLVSRKIEVPRAIGVEHRNLLREQQQERISQVVNARAIAYEEYALIATSQYATAEDKAAKFAYDLMVCYGVAKEHITADFLATYGSPKMMCVFRNMNRITRCESIAASIIAWRQAKDRGLTGETVDDLNSNSNLLRCMLAVSILNILCREEGSTYCEKVRQFENRYLLRHVLIERINEVLVFIRDHVDVITFVFAKKKERLAKKRSSLKSKLQFVNILLCDALGVKIVAADTFEVNQIFRLEIKIPVKWNEEKKSYEPLTTD